MDQFDVLIIGAGHAGAQAAASLRQLNFPGSIGLLTEEADFPYERPPLSKDYLAGDKSFDSIVLRQPDFWAARDIILLRGLRAQSIDPALRIVNTEGGVSIGYGTLIWAAGGHARRLSCTGHHLAGVHTVRSRADVDAMRAELETTSNVVVIGGGYIGLEAAAVLRKLGRTVTVVEMQNRVLARVAGEPLSRFYEAEHRAHGVTIQLETAVDCIEERNGRACGVRLGTGRVLPADMVVVGIGIIPAVQPLIDAGATCGNGVHVDEYCRTSLPNIYAIGDCAAHINRFAAGARIRLESVQNAADQAGVAAKSIAGTPIAYDQVPWFWSNQYDLKLQTIGLSLGYNDIVVRGEPASRSFSLVYVRQGRVIALDCVNAMRDYVQGKALVARGAIVEPALLSDTGLALKSFV
jgi:3-phenylpropionate/trans-cinnamate dioxygenase ferredoxin reductase subunit